MACCSSSIVLSVDSAEVGVWNFGISIKPTTRPASLFQNGRTVQSKFNLPPQAIHFDSRNVGISSVVALVPPYRTLRGHAYAWLFRSFAIKAPSTT